MKQDRYYALYKHRDEPVWVSYMPSFLTTSVVFMAHKIVRYDHRKNIYYYYKNREEDLRMLTDQEIIPILLSAIERNEFV